MGQTLGLDLPGRLERSCRTGGSDDAPGRDRIRVGSGAAWIERLAARFHGRAFAPHRHDTYAIGVTVSGVQTFRYRGVQRHSLPGECHILHPDELHDGVAGTDQGFSYRILYVDPALVHQALGGRPLPFVADPVIGGGRLSGEVRSAIMDIDAEMDALGAVTLTTVVAELLASVASDPASRRGPVDIAPLTRVRDAIAAQPEERHSLDELERLAGLDRWTLTRQFRRAFGVSPGRFRTMRQLDRVRGQIRAGVGLAEASFAAGFADQSHMTRHFKRTYGLTPARWAAIAA
jgi:AraC-like DNA-binding protein